ncbi:lysozyme inhibitor LprI family protein [Pelagovum pacificum]|uniref:lysozyme inhibitor LprI family protein n=1 Tax=Pelagovum pacificum TaxID=2588711 RepID=UPI001E4C17CA|nr:lysozyme inhibitor LprI family protein [Pelagovum pacificum]
MAHAEEGPAFDCAEAEGSVEQLICAEPDLAALDRRMADRFAAAVAVAEGLDTDAEETVRTLRAYQRGWISGRDECWKETDVAGCVRREYLFREAQLVAEFLLEPASNVTEYSCADGSALTVTLFETQLTAMRVEQGDRVGVGGAAGPEAPGTFYLQPMGSFVVGPDGAELVDPYGDAVACEVSG